MDDSQTATDSKPDFQAQQRAERGERTAENIRYGQTISEGGIGGMTKDQEGSVTQGGYGRVADRSGLDSGDSADSREASGYGGQQDMNKDVGA